MRADELYSSSCLCENEDERASERMGRRTNLRARRILANFIIANWTVSESRARHNNSLAVVQQPVSWM